MKPSFGVRSAFGTLERVLMHRPGPELDVVTSATLDEFNFARPVDRTRFVAEYDAMLNCFTKHKVDRDEIIRALESILRELRSS